MGFGEERESFVSATEREREREERRGVWCGGVSQRRPRAVCLWWFVFFIVIFYLMV